MDVQIYLTFPSESLPEVLTSHPLVRKWLKIEEEAVGKVLEFHSKVTLLETQIIPEGVSVEVDLVDHHMKVFPNWARTQKFGFWWLCIAKTNAHACISFIITLSL